MTLKPFEGPQAPDDKMEFRIFRRNRYHDFYDWLDGDWAWYEIPITDDGEEFHDQPVPATNEAWYINGFSFHAELGFSMLEEVVEYDGSPPLYFAIEAPSSIRRGEIVGIRMMGINNLNTEMMVLIILEASDDYRFVETGPDGEVEHYNPSLVAGEKHHMVAVCQFIKPPRTCTQFAFSAGTDEHDASGHPHIASNRTGHNYHQNHND